jgi:nitrous oxidase accessory protein
MQDCSNNNTFMRNSLYIIELGSGGSNVFVENNFWMQQEFPAGNFYDNGSVGNYWSWYEGVDANGDGLGDTPYVISSEV